jgi:hypothetical protein
LNTILVISSEDNDPDKLLFLYQNKNLIDNLAKCVILFVDEILDGSGLFPLVSNGITYYVAFQKQ